MATSWKEEIRTYEWVVYVWIAILSILSLIITLAAPVPPREVFANDPAVWRTPESESVPMWLVVLYMAIVSAVVAVTEFFVCPHRDRARYAAVRLWLGYIAMNLLTSSVTSLLKIYVAEARPDFLTRCFGAAGVPPPTYTTLLIQNVDDCPSGDEKLVREGRMSWPSGHSSSAMATSLFALIHLVYRTRRSDWVASQLAYVASTCLLIIGFIIGASRIVNNRHSPADVVSGFFVGLVCCLVYVVPLLWSMDRRYYPAAKNSSSSSSSSTQGFSEIQSHQADLPVDDE